MKYSVVLLALAVGACSSSSNPVMVIESPSSEAPAAALPVDETPQNELPTVDSPMTENPITETPSGETPPTALPPEEIPSGTITPEETPTVDTPAVAPPVEEIPAPEITMGEVRWSDGDSGRIAGWPFRLRDVDAPETGGVGAAIGGSKCLAEQELGQQAKAFIVALTENAALQVTKDYGPDRYDRNVVDLSADGIDVAAAGIEAGLLKPWPHDANGNSLSAKPNWCE